MPAFQFLALDEQGRQHKGLLEGDTARQIRQQLRERGLTPLNVDEVRGQARANSTAPATRSGRGRLSATELALITRQLATLIGSGLPIEEALGAVARQAEKARIASLLLAVRSRVLEGHTLANAFSDFPKVFPELYRATVDAGEQSGHLEIVFERLADYTEARQAMRQKVGLALFYPAILTVVAILVVAGLLTYVVPQVVQVFTNVKQELPGLTKGLIAVSDFLRHYGIVLLIGIALAVSGWRVAMRGLNFRRRMQRWQLRWPLVGRLTRGLNAARYARTFSILTASGVPVLDGLRISAQVIDNLPMREAVEHAAAKVREGASLSVSLQQSGYFPSMTVQLIASGEASGRLEQMLERAAQQQERESETVIAGLLGVFEPLLILTMGAVVLMIVLAILLPIFNLNQMIH